MTTTLIDIDKRARLYADARDTLAGIVAGLTESIEILKRNAMPELRRAVSRAAEHHDALKSLIEDAPELFEKPRTQTLHGVRVGYMKGKGGIAWDDPDAVIRAIEKYLPDQAEALIRWTAKPLKEAINQLDISDLKRIGCRVVDTGDQIVIKPVDSEVDKLVDALLKDAAESEAA